MGVQNIKNAVTENLAIVIAMVSLLIVSGMTAAASIAEPIRAGVITGASLIELYLMMYMIKQF